MSAPVVALKLTDDPDATVTLAGKVRAVLLLLAVTVIPPAGTTFDSVTVQELLPFDPRLEGLQATDETVMAVARLTLPLAEEPL